MNFFGINWGKFKSRQNSQKINTDCCFTAILPMKLKSSLKKFASFVTAKWLVFCKDTGLHGWKYIVAETSAWSRFFWFVICFTAIAISIGLVALSWMAFRADPMVTLPTRTQYEVAKLFFPTVTICSFNKISKRAAFDMAQKLNISNYTTVEKLAHSLKLLARLTDNKYHTLPEEEYSLLSWIFKQNHISEHQVFEQIAPSCKKLLKKCMWKNKAIECSIIFRTTKTPIGFCCSYNYKGLKQMPAIRNMTYFLKNSGCIFQTGLQVLLDNDPNDYFISNVPSIGFQVQVHNPFDFPHFALPTILSEVNTSNFISVSGEITGNSDAVKAMTTSERNCIFLYERQMNVTTRYTYQNCISECKVATIKEICGCVPFYLLVDADDSQIPCTIKDQNCIALNQDVIFDINRQRPHGESNNKCKCYPNCGYITYQSYISKGPLDLTYFKNPRSIESSRNLENFTVLRVFAWALKTRSYRRDVKFSELGLLAFFAGVVGLLTAFSFITVVEFIYLLGIRRNKKNDDTERKLRPIMVAPIQDDSSKIEF